MTRGEKNCNPGNLRYNQANQWDGQTGRDADGFCVFDTPEYGLRALAINLLHYQTKDNLHTVREIISRYSATDRAAYITNVASRLGVSPDVAIDLTDDATLAKLVIAVITQENGQVIYAQNEIDAAVTAA